MRIRISSRLGITKSSAVVASILVLGLLAALILLQRPGRDDDDLPKLRIAIGELENLNVDTAEALLLDLQESFPDDVSLQQNLAINAVARARLLSSTIDNVSLEPEVVEAARSEFPSALEQARKQAQRLQELVPDSPAAAWLRARVAMVEASQVPAMIQPDLLRANIEMLSETLEQHPDWLILAGPLIEALDNAFDESIGERCLPALVQASVGSPRNFYVALKAASQAVAAESDTAVELIQRTKLLAEPLVSETTSIAASLKLKPPEIADKILVAIGEDDWQTASLYTNYWVNIHKATAAFRTDYKLANPHELDLIAFDLSRKLALDWANEQQGVPPTEVRFEVVSPLVRRPSGRATAIQAFDFDLDGVEEFAAIVDDELAVFDQVDGVWTAVTRCDVESGSNQLLAADLFVVDSSSSDRLRKSSLQTQHDTFPSLIVCGPNGLRILQCNPAATDPADRLRPLARATGMESVRGITSSIVGDLDADGDLDIVLGTTEGVQLWINRGNMTFYAVESHSQLPPRDLALIQLHIVDFDRDLDLDVIAVQQDGECGLLENLLHTQFRWRPLTLSEENTSLHADSVAIAEVDGNVSWDIVAVNDKNLSCTLTETSSAGIVLPVETRISDFSGRQCRLAELNNDPLNELLTWSDNQVNIYSLGLDGHATPIGQLQASGTILGIDTEDLDGDGLVDCVLATDVGVEIATNTSVSDANSLRARFKGIDDNVSGRVNHYAVGALLELRFGPYYRAQVITSRTTHFGMGDYDEAITLRAVLPNGVTQNVIKPAANQLIEEQQTLKGSCPYLYAWDGEQFVFVTDCLWAAPLGLQVAPGKVVPDRPWEYLKVDGKFVAPRDGMYELRITEELWELAYIDHVQLFAVDHPEDVEMYTNEKVGPASIAEHTVHCFDPSSLQPIPKVLDTAGRDVTDRLTFADEEYVTAFQGQYCQGYCDPHWIELHLPEVTETDQLKLMLTGWIMPTDTSLNIQIAQNPDLAGVIHPVLEVPDGAGGWKTAIPYMGFPGGKTKTIVVDITGKLNLSDPRVRIRTSAQIYWDRVALAKNPPQVDSKTMPLQLASASLGFHGYSELLPRDRSEPHRYQYENASQAVKWPPLEGRLSRYGTATDLVEASDNSLVVMSSGDELRLQFRVPERPVPEGWKRDFVLHCVGWDKDADLNTLNGQTVGPLPFQEMLAYPPPMSQLHEAEDVAAQRISRLTRRQSFRAFWPRPQSGDVQPFLNEVKP